MARNASQVHQIDAAVGSTLSHTFHSGHQFMGDTTLPSTTFALDEQVISTLDAVGYEARLGLSNNPKTLTPWLFYDELGSHLFEQITELPEYYLTRTERSIFAAHAAEILREAALGQGPKGKLTLIELGAGTATKTGIL